MARRDDFTISNRRLAVGFAVLLVLLVAGRLVVAWIDSESGWVPRLVALMVLAVMVGLPAVYGLRGLIRDDGDDGTS